VPLGKSTCSKCGGEFQPWGFIFCPRCGDTPFHEKYPENIPYRINKIRDIPEDRKVEKAERKQTSAWQIPDSVKDMKW
jgi:uncharacterized Zn finger protein (UPF0148 family)